MGMPINSYSVLKTLALGGENYCGAKVKALNHSVFFRVYLA